MPEYIAYGLGIRSSMILPELEEGGNGEDVLLTEHVQPAGAAGEVPTSTRVNTLEFVRTHFPDVATLTVRRGKEIEVFPAPGVEARALRRYVLGAGMAIVLHQLGRLVLHASAVEVGDSVVAFVGESGRGKSVTAAALLELGHKLVSDDVLGVEVGGTNGRPTVHCGPRLLRLWPAAMSLLGLDASAAPRTNSREEKRELLLSQRSAAAALPFSRIYVLDEGPVTRMQDLLTRDAVFELVLNSYCWRLFTPDTAPGRIRQCADVAKSVPVRRLFRPNGLAGLRDIVAAVMDDLARDERGHPSRGVGVQ